MPANFLRVPRTSSSLAQVVHSQRRRLKLLVSCERGCRSAVPSECLVAPSFAGVQCPLRFAHLLDTLHKLLFRLLCLSRRCCPAGIVGVLALQYSFPIPATSRLEL